MEDTETLLALVSSLLTHPVQDQATILDALVQANGDVERAACSLNSLAGRKETTVPTKTKLKPDVKRKRTSGLEGWLLPMQKSGEDTASLLSPTKKRQMRRASPPSPRSSISTAHTAFVQGSSMDETAGSPTKVKPISQTEFMNLLRAPNLTETSTKPNPAKSLPLTLATPELVAKHTPCTMHLSVLPSDLACRLFYTMLDESEHWQRNKWWLFDRVVESPHRTSFYIRKSQSGESETKMHEAAQYWYNGRPTPPPDYFPSAMEEACSYVERIVNAELRKRDRYPMEWGGHAAEGHETLSSQGERIMWRANVAASNRYEGSSESVGFHSDQLTHLGPYPTIASLSLGTTRAFRLREVIPTDEKDTRSARTYNIPLPHNSLTIMHASCQETFKHSIPPQTVIDAFRPPFPPPPKTTASGSEGGAEDHVQHGEENPQTRTSNARINITFRFYRPDFQPSTIPRCKCDVPCILRPDMKNRYDRETGKNMVTKYWWTCYAGAQNEGKGCNMWKVMDVKSEGRGPFAGDVENNARLDLNLI